MKILLFGKNGQVGWELNKSLLPLGEVIALGREQADFSKPESLRKIICDTNPDVIVNAVAYTAVDKAEEEEDVAAIINAAAPGVLAEEALKINALLVHYSTDYVFDGKKEGPYLETDQPNPLSVYGRTKLSGEIAIQSSGCCFLIFRTSWVYAARGNNFLLTILRLAEAEEKLNIVADQYGAPTSAKLIAETTFLCLQQSVQQKKTGNFSSDLYHLTASGYTSWHGFAEEIVTLVKMLSGASLKIQSISGIPSADYPAPATRPMNSRLSKLKLENEFDLNIPDWRVLLTECVEELVKC
jgi:dTDP-4-dehydrorhamnose reductase